MFFLAGAAAGLILGLLAGGRLGNLAQLKFRWPLVVILALVVKDAAFLSSLATAWFVGAVYTLSLIGLLAWTLWHAPRLRAMWLVSVGIAMNLMVVAANGGHMTIPLALARKAAPVAQGIAKYGQWGQYMLQGPNTHLNWLGDWLEMPWPLYRYFPQAYSPGDFVMFFGIVILVFLGTSPRLAGLEGRLQIADGRSRHPGV